MSKTAKEDAAKNADPDAKPDDSQKKCDEQKAWEDKVHKRMGELYTDEAQKIQDECQNYNNVPPGTQGSFNMKYKVMPDGGVNMDNPIGNNRVNYGTQSGAPMVSSRLAGAGPNMLTTMQSEGYFKNVPGMTPNGLSREANFSYTQGPKGATQGAVGQAGGPKLL